jgi:hypothetical protein
MSRNLFRAITVLGPVCFVLLPPSPGVAQNGPSAGPPLPSQVSPSQQSPFGETSDPDPEYSQKRLRAMNADRQKSLVADSERLLKLARQLDAEIAANTSNDLTPEELGKVAAIEKLAHSVRQKMALSYTGAPKFHNPDFPGRMPGSSPLGP